MNDRLALISRVALSSYVIDSLMFKCPIVQYNIHKGGRRQKKTYVAQNDLCNLMAKRKCTKDEIVSEIKRLHSNGNEISCNYCLFNRSELYNSARKCFGTWEKAVNAAGIDYGIIRKRRKPFSKAELLAWLRAIQAQGLPLDWTTVRTIDFSMTDSIIGKFGSYRAAIEELGLDYDTINKQKLAGQVDWTRQKVLDSLKSYVEKHGNLGYLCREDSKLYHSSRRYFGSFEKAALAAGLDYGSLRLRKKWSKEAVIQAIRDVVESEGTLAFLEKKNPSLALAATWRFGGVYNAAEAAGLDASKLRIHKKWTKEAVIQKLHGYVEKHGDLSLMQNKDVPLSLAVIHHFGSLEKAALEAGLDYGSLLSRNVWSDARVIEELKADVRKNGGLDLLAKRNPALVHSAIYRFGSLEKATIAAGLDFDSLRTRKNWTNEKIIRNILELYRVGEDLSLSHAFREFGPLVQSAGDVSHFGSWKNAIDAAGLDYDSIRRNWLLETFRGAVFEGYVRRVLHVLGWNVAWHRRFKYGSYALVPDFFELDSGTWIDAKTDPWGAGVDSTIETYVQHTSSLKIIHLKKKTRKSKDSRVEFVPIDFFFSELRERGAGDLVGDIELLRKGILKPELQSRLSRFIDKRPTEDKVEVTRLVEDGKIPAL